MEIKKIIIIVIDGLGVGALPDAEQYGDSGSHTLDNTARVAGGLQLPNLRTLGLGYIEGVLEVERVADPVGAYGRMAEASSGKDTITGHLEMAGIIQSRPYATFSQGFSEEILDKFTKVTGFGWLCGKAVSGTEIIERLGVEHLATGKLIVYTSADSVFQIAAHEDVLRAEDLYKVCEKVRAFLDDYKIQRVIARPFVGKAGAFTRTYERRDFSILPPKNLLDNLIEANVNVIGVGKIGDIFSHRGLNEEIHTAGDMEGMDKTIKALRESQAGGGRSLIFTNLVDFDMRFAHRQDARGCARTLEAIDKRLPELMELLGPEDLLFITGDHGCDPTTPSTDHSREYVPLLVYGDEQKGGVNLGTRETFADLGATILDAFGLTRGAAGLSMLPLIKA